MKKINFIVAFVFLIVSNSYSQIISKESGQILVKGIITDSYDGKPAGVEIRFEDEKGKFFKINSNSITGAYEQILESGHTYKVRLNSKMMFPTDYTIQTKKTENYSEQEQNFSITRIEIGRSIECLDLFSEDSSELKPDAKALFDELNLKMKFNRNVSLFLEVSGCDSRKDFYEVKQTKIKKKVKIDSVFSEQNYKNFVQSRFDILSGQINSLTSFPERVEVKAGKLNEKGHKEFEKFGSGCDVILRVKDYKEKLK